VSQQHQHQGGEEFELRFIAMGSDVPPISRVRQLLRAALRSWRLRCTSARDVTKYPDPPETGQRDTISASDDSADAEG
jgi:hypothetical protein